MSVEDRLTALEKGSQFEADQAAVQKVEAECLQKLRAIESALANGGGASGASTKEVETLRQENDALKTKLAKLEYRISHIVSSMENLYEENKQLKGKQ